MAQNKLISCYNFGVVIVNKPGTNTYLAVNETRNRGWWIPAGFIDPGESIEDGAKRECVEEGGINPKMTGVLRVEWRPNRARWAYLAEPENPEQKPKSEPDSESLGAEFVTVEHMTKVARRGKCRGPELLWWGEYLDKGGVVAPLDFLVTNYNDKNPSWARGNGGTPTKTTLIFIVQHGNQLLVEKQAESNQFTFIRTNVEDPGAYHKTLFNSLKSNGVEYNEESRRVARVYHTMENNGATVRIILACTCTATTNPKLVCIGKEDFSELSKEDGEYFAYASQDNHLQDLAFLVGENKKPVARKTCKPDSLFKTGPFKP